MARIFITGSADGLGMMAARLLIGAGHEVVLHARNEQRAAEALKNVPGALTALAGDLSSMAEITNLAQEANRRGPFDAVIHNAAVGYREPAKIKTVDGLAQVFAVNSLAPYMLTCLMEPAKRLVYLSSGLHRSGDASLQDLNWEKRRWSGIQAYSDSKLHDIILAFAVARRWPAIYSNALEPGWVATKMGGSGAPDSLEEGPRTQAWLAGSQDAEALVTGKYFYHQKLRPFLPAAADPAVQDELLEACAGICGVRFPLVG